MGRKEDLKQVDKWARWFGIDRNRLSSYIHSIKIPGKRRNPDLVVDRDNGNIFIKGTDEYVGNVYDCR